MMSDSPIGTARAVGMSHSGCKGFEYNAVELEQDEAPRTSPSSTHNTDPDMIIVELRHPEAFVYVNMWLADSFVHPIDARRYA